VVLAPDVLPDEGLRVMKYGVAVGACNVCHY